MDLSSLITFGALRSSSMSGEVISIGSNVINSLINVDDPSLAK